MLLKNKIPNFDLAVVGGGPAGMMSAISAAENHPKIKIVILERNSNLGEKLLLTGKGRCNLTTTKTIPEIIKAFPSPQGQFLYNSLSQFSNRDLIHFFENRRVALQEERGQRIFPEKGNSELILKCLEQEIQKKKIRLYRNFRAIKITQVKEQFRIVATSGKTILTNNLILATGGKSYPATGSTGDGYKLAAEFGHNIIKVFPALVPLIVKDKQLHKLSGLSLKNVTLSFHNAHEKISEEFGEMLFTHFGISGPIVLTQSETVFHHLVKNKEKITACIDLKPALTEIQLQKRLQREMETIGKKEYTSLLENLLPKSLVYFFAKSTRIDLHRQIGSLQKEEKNAIVTLLKNFTFEIDGVMPIENGIVTGGGLDVREIDPKTMHSKITPHLYFAGEIIGIHGKTGGFNLTKAFTTGYVAGKLLFS